MICKKCGTEIESGLVYCPSCGESIQLVPNYDVLEEELLSRVVEDKDKSKDDQFATGVYTQTKTPVAKTNPEAKSKICASPNALIRNKDFLKKIVIFLIIVTFGMMIIIPYIGSHSYDNLMNKAVEAEANKQYAKALGYFEEAYEVDNTSFEVIYGLGRMYYRVKEYDNAVAYLLMALEDDPANKTIFTYLLDCYDQLHDTDGIYRLRDKAPNDSIASLFDDYLIYPPEFSEAGGDYDADVTLVLTSEQNYQVFYTLDGKDPTVSGKLFSKAITLKEGETVVKAVTRNNSGEYSEIVSETYNVTYAKLSTPVVTPEAGTYTEQVYISIAVPSGCKAYYSWDGTDPSSVGIEYSEPFPILKGASVLSVVIIDSKGNVSPVYHGDYIYNP
ncbi:chitobiase/beta-hexosaminidase C-terminal domain-containing protein [Pseudobutyrivibrio xylanivorans]|uniref:Tetratricopeptide repeat protein n=1 Tax=Pseudobutyrivibrio xylanivorans TaxID=185007 RepID=A0A5P6VSG8_PSEXY|nr:chitobiase/beta-hexosaminidase C-terminal domain-containing protein [Pseudobutyrivibrio xylanivorans]QFJ55587.1 tetratricopeptide repeat protein [Pseudobutyrivibrio xylanivorans]